MDSSPQSTRFSHDEQNSSVVSPLEEEHEEEEHAHIHMPNPSYWPFVLGVALALAFIGLLVINFTPVVFIVALVLVLIGIMGWALENPMAPLPDIFVRVRAVRDPWKYKIGQGVVDSQGHWLGKISARFPNYVLVVRGRVMQKVYYVPQSAIKEQVKNNTLFLTMSEAELVAGGYNSVPDDLYQELPEAGVPRVRGAAQFARRPLSPAETGHYNYGRHWPGINTDAANSYYRREINPTPQTYVTEGPIYLSDEPIPPREVSSD
jgi:hypothetical protein